MFDCGERQYFGTRVSLTRSDDRSREREFDALYVGTRAVLRANRLRGHGLIGNLGSRRTSMTKKISFFVVTAAAVALVLSGCSRGPGMDDMDMATRRHAHGAALCRHVASRRLARRNCQARGGGVHDHGRR